MTWIDGSPRTENSGYYWLKMHDQGGHSFAEIGFIHMEFPEGYVFDYKTYDPDMPLEAWVSIPGLNVNTKLKNVWNIDAHMKIEYPEILA